MINGLKVGARWCGYCAWISHVRRSLGTGTSLVRGPSSRMASTLRSQPAAVAIPAENEQQQQQQHDVEDGDDTGTERMASIPPPVSAAALRARYPYRHLPGGHGSHLLRLKRGGSSSSSIDGGLADNHQQQQERRATVELEEDWILLAGFDSPAVVQRYASEPAAVLAGRLAQGLPLARSMVMLRQLRLQRKERLPTTGALAVLMERLARAPAFRAGLPEAAGELAAQIGGRMEGIAPQHRLRFIRALVEGGHSGVAWAALRLHWRERGVLRAHFWAPRFFHNELLCCYHVLLQHCVRLDRRQLGGAVAVLRGLGAQLHPIVAHVVGAALGRPLRLAPMAAADWHRMVLSAETFNLVYDACAALQATPLALQLLQAQHRLARDEAGGSNKEPDSTDADASFGKSSPPALRREQSGPSNASHYGGEREYTIRTNRVLPSHVGRVMALLRAVEDGAAAAYVAHTYPAQFAASPSARAHYVHCLLQAGETQAAADAVEAMALCKSGADAEAVPRELRVAVARARLAGDRDALWAYFDEIKGRRDTASCLLMLRDGDGGGEAALQRHRERYIDAAKCVLKQSRTLRAKACPEAVEAALRLLLRLEEPAIAVQQWHRVHPAAAVALLASPGVEVTLGRAMRALGMPLLTMRLLDPLPRSFPRRVSRAFADAVLVPLVRETAPQRLGELGGALRPYLRQVGEAEQALLFNECLAGAVRAAERARAGDACTLVFRQLREAGLAPSARSWHVLLHAVARGGHYKRAVALAEENPEVFTRGDAGSTPTLTAQKLLLLAAIKAEVGAAGGFGDAAEQDAAVQARWAALPASQRDLYTYTMMVDHHVRAGAITKVDGVLAEMRGLGVMPSSVTLGTVMQFYAERGDVRAVKEFLEQEVRHRFEGVADNVLSSVQSIFDAFSTAEAVPSLSPSSSSKARTRDAAATAASSLSELPLIDELLQPRPGRLPPQIGRKLMTFLQTLREANAAPSLLLQAFHLLFRDPSAAELNMLCTNLALCRGAGDFGGFGSGSNGISGGGAADDEADVGERGLVTAIEVLKRMVAARIAVSEGTWATVMQQCRARHHDPSWQAIGQSIARMRSDSAA